MIRRQGRARREELLRAAGAAVLERGFGAVTADDLAAAVDISPRLLHHYFTGMGEVFVRAFEYIAAEDRNRLLEAVEGCADPCDQLDAILQYATPESGDRSWILWFDAANEARRTPALRVPFAELAGAWTQTLTGVVERGKEAGCFTCHDPSLSVRTLLALIDGIAFSAVTFSTIDQAQALAIYRRFAEAEFGLEAGGLRRRAAASLANGGAPSTHAGRAASRPAASA